MTVLKGLFNLVAIGESSNGRTADSDSAYLGSNPSSPATISLEETAMKRVVVTGLGIVSPLGNNLESNWKNVIEGKSGIRKIQSCELSPEMVQIGGEACDFDPKLYMLEKEVNRTQRFVHLSVAACKQAMAHAGITSPFMEAHGDDVAMVIGVGVGGMSFMEECIQNMISRGPKWVSPFTIPGFIANMAAGIASIEVGARGPNICTTTACTSGTHAIGEALMLIQTGRAKAAFAGGAESAISKLSYAGFGKMKALCTKFQNEPEKASRPFDGLRCGFVMGEGAGVLMLEELEFAKARGANILCELKGYGLSGDAYHMTSPAPEGMGAQRCIRQALKSAGVEPSEVGYINAHGTSTEANDACETQAIKAVFGTHAKSLLVSSTKSMTGHLLGAAGGVEAVYSVMSLLMGEIPPTINQEVADPDCDLNYVPNEAIRKKVKHVLSNSFGFGGTNGSLLFSQFH